MKALDLLVRVAGSAVVGVGFTGAVPSILPEDAANLLFILILYSFLKVSND
jgi:hypothetical protein